MPDTPSLNSFSVFSVADLNAYIRALLESNINLMDIWVSGEVSNISRPRSGHIYFTLKDESASVRCIIWHVNAGRMGGKLLNGMMVEVHGHVSVYEGGGQYQLNVDGIRTAGEGRLYREFLILKEKLAAEGLFDEDNKRAIPSRPKLIGIVTSPTGAALQDMLNTLRMRYPLAEVVLSPASVQGEVAPAQIVEAIEKLNQCIHPDVILVGRGGGSLEDLWAFNDERVVRAIAASEAPIISGVGHETDFTLADFAADARASTPTGAAVMAVPDINELNTALDGWDYLLGQEMKNLIDQYRKYLLDKKIALSQLSPGSQVRQNMQWLDNIS
ncbi:MAG: exodeoxyribonuclease VII large subunit, partial [Anaerolineaceae bacterium]|nr:exodeoxyribonuclease VII large subunit [Anaerolineaceae bacterium]